ncbi:hypothetical protein [Rhizobium nepotum]|uniref:hypothetical protein n=1 Tax=Rhizobium nepotum TaxID=1035271 RepID=UPI003CECB119
MASVVAFTMCESVEDVARVERSTANRMANERGWFGWLVTGVYSEPTDDGLMKITVHAIPVGGGYRPDPEGFAFVSDFGQRRSPRFDAFIKACGGGMALDDVRHLAGRYFSTRNGGRDAGDFGPLTKALVTC